MTKFANRIQIVLLTGLGCENNEKPHWGMPEVQLKAPVKPKCDSRFGVIYHLSMVNGHLATASL
jgi:hypothetical protein